MIDVKEALNIELLDSYIDSKNESLNEIIALYNDLIKKYKGFVKNYKDTTSSLSELISKKSEALYEQMNDFYNSFESINSKISSLKNNLINKSSRFEGDITLSVENKLLLKLEEELKLRKENVKALIDSYINEFKESQKAIDKALSKLSKLKNKELKNIN